jgi:hypothetical protein
MTDEEGYLLCVELFESDYSEEDIADFVMRKFLKNIHNNYSFVINKMDKPVVEDNIVVEEKNTAVKDNIVVEDTIHVIIEKPVVEDKPKKASKKSEEENDYDMESYLDHFNANTNYINQQRISIFKSTFNSQLTKDKIGKIINQYFKVSSTRIDGKKTKVYQLADEYVGNDEREDIIKK